MNISRRGLVAGGCGLAAAAGLGWLAWPGASIRPGHSRARAVASDEILPSSADAVVIGGGNSGVNTAFCLAERGLRVALCEKGVIAGEASGRSLGWIHSLYVPPILGPIVERAKLLWAGLNERVGQDTSYRRSGLAVLFADEKEQDEGEKWIASVTGNPSYDPRLLSSDESRRLMSADASTWTGALYQPSDAIADPRFFAAAVAEGARRRGASIHQNCAARGIERSAGRVSAVVTEKGTIRTERVILTGGYWSTAFCRNLGIDVAQLPVFTSLASLTPFDGGPAVSGTFSNDGWRIEPDGGFSIGRRVATSPIEADTFRFGLRYLPSLWEMYPGVRPVLGSDYLRSLALPNHWGLDEVSPFERLRVLEPEPWNRVLSDALSELQGVLPAFRRTRIRERWAGVIVSAADGLPVLSPIRSIPGLIVGTAITFGLCAAPAVGELLADMATGSTPKVDPKPFRYERMIDGSPMRFVAEH